MAGSPPDIWRNLAKTLGRSRNIIYSEGLLRFRKRALAQTQRIRPLMTEKPTLYSYSADEIREGREFLRNLLSLISSTESQRQYEQEVPIANVPAELVCMWFDDHYHPESVWFRACYSHVEQLTLAEFSQFYKERLDLLPDTAKIEELQKSECWNQIMEKAARTVASIEW